VSSAPFGARLASSVAARGALCVGIDPHPGLLQAWGLADDVSGLASFASTVVTALAGEVAVLKPQSAFFERHGAAGVAVLEETMRAARSAGALVLLDVKRGDIAPRPRRTPMPTYAPTPRWRRTRSRSALPRVRLAAPVPGHRPSRGGRGVRAGVDVEPEGATVQNARHVTEDVGGGSISTTVADSILAGVRAENAGDAVGSVGVVVGATIESPRVDLDVNGPLLVPGLGAQGGTASDVTRLFADVRQHVLPSVSRSVLSAGPDVSALRDAARSELEALTRSQA
jgi:orotidine-5'-phosphate decarboxylase